MYGEKPYGEKPYTSFPDHGEKPYTSSSDRGENPYIEVKALHTLEDPHMCFTPWIWTYITKKPYVFGFA